MNVKKAQQIYDTLIEALDERKWKYNADPNDLTVQTGVIGDDFPISILFVVDPKRDCVTFRTGNIITFDAEQILEAAVATCSANDGLVFGHFILDISDGSFYYSYSDSYEGCEVTPSFFQNMIGYAVSTVDHYNDRFIMLQKGKISLKQFLELDR